MAKNGFKVMDSDMHIMEPPDLWQRYLEPEFLSQAPRGLITENVRELRMVQPDGVGWGFNADREQHGKGPDSMRPGQRQDPMLFAGHNYEANQKTYLSHSERGWSPEVQIEAMDAEGLDVAVLYPSRGLMALTKQNMEPRFAAALARAYNNWLYDFSQAYPGRLYGSAMISPFDIGSAIEEATRCAKELGFVSVFMRANIVNGRNWDEPYYEPLWSALEDLDLPMGWHEATTSASRQTADNFLSNFMMRRLYAQPMEQMLAVGPMCLGGVLARHPKLRMAFLEANCSWVPWLLWRMDEGWEREGDILAPDLKEPPSAYFRRQCWVSIEPDEEPARYALDFLGNDKIVYSTDYPHGDSKYPLATEQLLKLDITEEDKRKILWDNCASFYGLEVPART
jgi:predicted TIM-barrel fold metal-dependent hydrolase